MSGTRKVVQSGALTARQRDGLVALLVHPTVAAASQATGIHRNTLLNWKRDPVFLAELRSVSREMSRDAVNQLNALSTLAASTFRQALTGDRNLPWSRMFAASRTFELVKSFAEMDIAEQVDEMRERLRILEAEQQAMDEMGISAGPSPWQQATTD